VLADSFHIALGDLPTWGLFVGAVTAALIALRQLTIQRRDSAALNRQLIRQQANDVDTTRLDGAVVMVRSGEQDYAAAGKAVILVVNNSKRPIRDVHCWLETRRARDWSTASKDLSGQPRARDSKARLMPHLHGPVTEERRLNHTHAVEPVPLSGTGIAPAPILRPGLTYGFVFDMTPDDAAAVGAGFPLASRPMVLFTDDADNMWRIDDDLRLREVSPIRIGSRGMRARLVRFLTGTS
jgi:hypothetical protein